MMSDAKLVLRILKLCSAGSRDHLQENSDNFHTCKVQKLKKLL